jgi:hypothetical protein
MIYFRERPRPWKASSRGWDDLHMPMNGAGPVAGICSGENERGSDNVRPYGKRG